jgi:hypothetical protein
VASRWVLRVRRSASGQAKQPDVAALVGGGDVRCAAHAFGVFQDSRKDVSRMTDHDVLYGYRLALFDLA